MGTRDLDRRTFVKAAFAAGTVGAVSGAIAEQKSNPLEVKLGLNLLVYTAVFSKDQLDLVKKVADIGYNGVEIPFNDLSVLDAAATRRAREAANIGLTTCAVMLPGTSITSPDPAERKAGLNRLNQITDITAEMGGDVVGGPLYAPVRMLTGRARSDDEWKWAAENLRAAAEHAAPAKITLAIEPLNRFETHVFNIAADAVKLVREVNHPNLKVQIDTFHSNIEEKDTAAAIINAGDIIGHFHASESDRGVPGTGQVRWEEAFDALRKARYRGWVVIESFATGIVDLCAAACVWRPLYDSADSLAINGLKFLKEMVGAE